MRSGTDARTWCPFAKRYPGPDRKLGYSDFKYSPKRGATLHDSTGPLAPTLNTLMGERIASWTFTIEDSNGDLYEHYAIEGNTWHGNDTDSDDAVEANYDLVGIEFTRASAKFATPISEASIQTVVRLLRWLGDVCGLDTFVRFPDQIGAFTLSDHNQVANSPTACPSGRIPFAEILRRLQTEEGDTEMRIAHSGPGSPAYLLVGGRAIYIPSTVYDDVVGLVYGNVPAALKQETWDWLKANQVYVE